MNTMAEPESRNAKVGLAVLGALVVAFLGVLAWLAMREPDAPTSVSAAKTADQEPVPAGPEVEDKPASSTFVDGRPTWKPGNEHWYGADPEPFVRQPHDYDMDTPEILGNRISYHIYDLETVVDMVSRGDQDDSEIARVKGRPLTSTEKEAGRRLLQEFFDDTVPNVDRLIEGSMTTDDGYDLVGPRRRQMNEDLRGALGLNEDQFYKIWPHIKDLEESIDELREPGPEDERKRHPPAN